KAPTVRRPAVVRVRDRAAIGLPRACAWLLPCSRSLHAQSEPAVGGVVLTLHDPVVAGIGDADHDIFDGRSDQLVVRVEKRRDRRPELLECGGTLEVLAGDTARVVASAERLVGAVHCLEEIAQEIAIRLDLAGGVVVFDHEDADVLARRRRVVGVQLHLAEQQDTATPVEAVLIEVVRGRLLLAGALVVGERVRLALLAQDVDLKFRRAFQPTLKVVHKTGLGHVQPRSNRRWHGPPPPPPPQYARHGIRLGATEKSVSTGTTAITGVAGGRSGSSSVRLPRTSNATGAAWSATAVATKTSSPPVHARRCSGTGRYISSGIARFASRVTSAVVIPVVRASAAAPRPPSAARNRWNGSLCSRNGERSSCLFTWARKARSPSARANDRANCSASDAAEVTGGAAIRSAAEGAGAWGCSEHASATSSNASAATRNV